MSATVVIEGMNGFAEDKDQARILRTSIVLPSLQQRDPVILDFAGIQYATQSFVHVLIGEALQRYGEPVLDVLEFRNCTDAVRSVIELVVDYSLGGFVQKKGA